MGIISSEENIGLAYRNIKSNKGSKTAGADGKTIDNLKNWSSKDLVRHIQKSFEWYKRVIETNGEDLGES